MIKNRLSIFCIASLTLAASAFANDTIVLKNGDILTGEILKQTADHVYFRSGAFGSVSLQTTDIAKIRLNTNEKNEVSVQPGTVASPNSTTFNPYEFVGPPIPPAPSPEKKESSKWSGQAGLSIARRNSTQSDANGVIGRDQYDTYRVYGNMDWKAKSNKMHWDWTYRYSRDEVRLQDDYLNLTQQYSHDFNRDYYAAAKSMYQRDYRRQITREYLQTAEMGINWINQPDLQFSTSAGGGYHHYDRIRYNETTQSDEELSITQPKFIFDESLRWQMINSLTLIQKYTHLGDLTNYHFVFTAGLENKLIRDIFLRCEYRLDRDTEVYYDDHGYYDKALLTSLLYKF